MDTTLVAATLVSLAMATALSVVVWRHPPGRTAAIQRARRRPHGAGNAGRRADPYEADRETTPGGYRGASRATTGRPVRFAASEIGHPASRLRRCSRSRSIHRRGVAVALGDDRAWRSRGASDRAAHADDKEPARIRPPADAVVARPAAIARAPCRCAIRATRMALHDHRSVENPRHGAGPIPRHRHALCLRSTWCFWRAAAR